MLLLQPSYDLHYMLTSVAVVHTAPCSHQAYKDSGDTASKKGDRIWIAEMYGYSFGAAKSNVWHKWHHDFMLYPSYTPSCAFACLVWWRTVKQHTAHT